MFVSLWRLVSFLVIDKDLLQDRERSTALNVREVDDIDLFIEQIR